MSKDIDFGQYDLEELDKFERAINGATAMLTNKHGNPKSEINASEVRAAEYLIWLVKQHTDLKKARAARAQLESNLSALTREVETLKSDLTAERLRRGRAEKEARLLREQLAADDG